MAKWSDQLGGICNLKTYQALSSSEVVERGATQASRGSPRKTQRWIVPRDGRHLASFAEIRRSRACLASTFQVTADAVAGTDAAGTDAAPDEPGASAGKRAALGANNSRQPRSPRQRPCGVRLGRRPRAGSKACWVDRKKPRSP